MARTSAKAKKSKEDVEKDKQGSNKNDQIQEEILTKKIDNSDVGSRALMIIGKDNLEVNNIEEGLNNVADKENDHLNFKVEKILQSRLMFGKTQYLVRWKGYKENGDTWENESVLQSSPEVFNDFKKENQIVNKKSKEEKDTNVQKKRKTNTKYGTGKPTNKQPKSKKIKIDKEKCPKKVSNKNKNIYQEKNTEKNVSDSMLAGRSYEVEEIIEIRIKKNGSREFLIRWKGYKPSEDTWEPEEHLDCADLIDEFMAKVVKAKSPRVAVKSNT